MSDQGARIASRGAIRVELVDSTGSFEALAGAWDACLANDPEASVFQTFEWNWVWWNTFARSGDRLRIWVARSEDNDTVLGIAPFCIRGRSLELIGVGNYASDYAALVLAEGSSDVADLLVAAAFRDVEWSLLTAMNVCAESSTRKAIERHCLKHGVSFFSDKILDAPTRVFSDPAVDRKLLTKKSIKRKWNEFQREGTLTCDHFESSEDIERWLPVFWEQHISRRALVGGDESLFTDEQQREFYRQFSRVVGRRGWVRFSVVKHNDRPVAFHIGFEFRKRFYWYKPSFDPALERKSPGKILLKFLLEKAIDENLTEFDFTVGSEGYKYHFANVVRSVYRITVYRSRIAYLSEGASRAIKDWTRPIRRKVSSGLIRNVGASSGLGSQADQESL